MAKKVEQLAIDNDADIKEKAKEKDKKQKAKKKAKEAKPKTSKVKETFSELKKVSWPSFGKTVKQTGAVLVVVLLFMLVILGMDSLVSFLVNLIGKI